MTPQPSWRILLTTLVISFLNPAGVLADQGSTTSQGNQWEERPQSLAVFLGLTTIPRTRSTGASVGLEYEYRLPYSNQMLGLGPMVTATLFNEIDVSVAGVLSFHPVRELRIVAGPGVKFGEGIGSYFMLRLGAAYDFELGNYSLSPTVYADLITAGSTDTIGRSNPAVVYGLTFGYRF